MVTQRALPRQEGPPDSPCPAMLSCSCWKGAGKVVGFREKFFWMRCALQKGTAHDGIPAQKTHPRFCFLPSRHSVLSAQPRIPSCSADVEVGSTWASCAAGHTPPELSQAPVPPVLLPFCSYIQGMQLPFFCSSGWVCQTSGDYPVSCMTKD